eukprot:3046901-Amphidinium_carterae.1
MSFSRRVEFKSRIRTTMIPVPDNDEKPNNTKTRRLYYNIETPLLPMRVSRAAASIHKLSWPARA